MSGTLRLCSKNRSYFRKFGPNNSYPEPEYGGAVIFALVSAKSLKCFTPAPGTGHATMTGDASGPQVRSDRWGRTMISVIRGVVTGTALTVALIGAAATGATVPANATPSFAGMPRDIGAPHIGDMGDTGERR